MLTVATLHSSLAVAALLLGAGVLARRKGTRSHRALGQLYVVAMLGVNGTALAIYRLFGEFGPFHWFALLSLATVAAGIVPAMFRRPAGNWTHWHGYFMSWSYVGLLAAAAAEAMVRLPWVRVYSSSFTVSVVSATIGVTVLGGVAIARLLPRTLRELRARLGTHTTSTAL